MADNRTGLSAADLAAQFRDICGDGSMEWVYTPMQTWVLLDAADMLDENDKLREEVCYLKKGDVLHVLTDQEFAEQQKHKREMQASIKALDDENAELRRDLEEANSQAEEVCIENAKLRELVEDMLDCIEIKAAWHRPPTEEMCEEFAKRASELEVVE